MPVSLTCTGCKTTLKVRDDLAGKKVKCPRCATALIVPNPEEEIVEVDALPEDRISKAPTKDKPRSRRDDPEDDEDRKPRSRRDDPDDEDEEEDRGRGRGRDEKRSAGIRTGRNRDRDRDEEDEDDRPRAKGKRRDRDEDDDDDDRDRDVRKSKYKPCPRCEATGAKKVLWTAWGSFYGPSMFHHVRCPECSYCYNGKTGGSNLIPAIIFVAVPLLGILAIIGGLFFMLFKKGYFG